MPPPDFGFVFLIGVGGVRNQDVGIAAELDGPRLEARLLFHRAHRGARPERPYRKRDQDFLVSEII